MRFMHSKYNYECIEMMLKLINNADDPMKPKTTK